MGYEVTDERIILKIILDTQYMKMWARLNWLSVQSIGGISYSRWWSFGLHKVKLSL